MNAQGKWKVNYRRLMRSHSKRYKKPIRAIMIRFLREAALERRVERLQRENVALQTQVWQLEAQEHNRADGNEWENYLRGLSR